MNKKLFVELFRFNSKTDYLPYYKKYDILYSKEESVLDLLNKINAIEKFSFEGTSKYGVKINSLYVSLDASVAELVEKTDNSFVIEPVSTYRAVNDLSIKNDDFFEKLDLLDEYLDESQKNIYADSLQLEYYSSNSLNFNKDYIGDHVLIAASDIIAANNDLKDEIGSIIDNKSNGIRYYTSKEKRVLNCNLSNKEKIETLLQEVTALTINKNETTDIKIGDIAQEFVDFNIAVYDKNDTSILEEFVVKSKAKFVETLTKNDDTGLVCETIDKSFSYKIAGSVLLDAKDNNADFIIVNSSKDFEIFDNKQKEISKAVGRDIDMPVVTLSQFNSMLSGEKDPSKLGFDNHKVNIPFL